MPKQHAYRLTPLDESRLAALTRQLEMTETDVVRMAIRHLKATLETPGMGVLMSVPSEDSKPPRSRRA